MTICVTICHHVAYNPLFYNRINRNNFAPTTERIRLRGFSEAEEWGWRSKLNLTKENSLPSGNSKLCFGQPEIFRAAQNTTCYYRLVMNFPSSNWVLTFSLILRLRKTLAAVSAPLSVQSYCGLSCCKIAGYMQRDDIWWHRSSPPSKHGDGMKKYPFICSMNGKTNQ